jgi:hypothetical protein
VTSEDQPAKSESAFFNSVSEYSARLGEHLKLPEEQLIAVRMGKSSTGS